MNISILVSSFDHPVYPYLRAWRKTRSQQHNIQLVQNKSELKRGDILFLISCHEIIRQDIRSLYNVVLLVHSSDLPKGRGWSPQLWQILEGKNDITVTLCEAVDNVDSGDIWAREVVSFAGHELYDEINSKLYAAWLQLLDHAIDNVDKIKPWPQAQTDATYYKKRTPDDSRLFPEKSLAEQFDLLRIADPDRFPAFLDYRGHRYIISIHKASGYGKGQ